MTRSQARPAVLAWLLLLTGVAAGCGSAEDGSRVEAPARDAAPVEAPARPQPAVTDGGLGDATAGSDREDERELSGGGPLDLAPPRAERRREGVGAGDSCPDAEVEASAANLAKVVAATTCLLNGERRDRGLVALTANPLLLKAATVHARDMVTHSYFSHTGRDGTQSGDRIQAAGYMRGASSWLVGENLAWGSGAMSTPRIIMRAWMNSPGHRDNMLEPEYREVGLAVVAGNPETPDGTGATYVTEFGGRTVAPASRSRRSAKAPASRARARRSSGRGRG